MKSRQEQLVELRYTVLKIWGPMFLAAVPILCLWQGAMAVAARDRFEGNPSDSFWLASIVALCCILLLVFHYPMRRLRVEGRLSDTLQLLERVPREVIDRELVMFAQLAADASEEHIQAQGATSRAGTEEEEDKLQKEEDKKKGRFDYLSKRFYDYCSWAESGGHPVCRTPNGRFSYKLYTSPKQVVGQPTPAPSDSDSSGDDIPF